MSIYRRWQVLTVSWVVLCLLLSVGLLAAQDGPTATFTSEFQDLTFEYPADWLVEEPGAAEVLIANSADALALADSEFAAYPPGSILVRWIITGPPMGGEQSTPEEFLQLMSPALSEALADIATVGDIETTSLDGRNAATLTLSSEVLGFETLMVVAETGNSMLSTLTASSAAGEMSQFQDEVLAMAASASTLPREEQNGATPVPAVAVTPLSGQLETYASANDVFTFAYPVEWLLVDPNTDLPGVMVGNAQSLLDQADLQQNWDFDIPAGGLLLTVRATETEGLTVTEMASGAGIIMGPNLGPNGTIGDPVSITVDGQPGYRIDSSSLAKGFDVTMLVFEVDNLSGMILAFAHEGEIQNFDSQIMALAESIEPAGTQPVTSATTTPIVKGTPVPTTAAAEPINYGDAVTRTLASGEEAQFTFEGQEGDAVTIRVTSEFDNYVELYDSSGEYLMDDDDSGGDFNAMIRRFPLPASDTYTIIVTAYDYSETGEYTLELTQETFAPPSTLRIGEFASGNLNAEYDEWTFQGAGGDTVNVLLVGGFDTVVEVYSADGTLLASNDDSLDYNVSYAENIVLPAAGTYTIRVLSYGEEQGLYLLSVGYAQGLTSK